MCQEKCCQALKRHCRSPTEPPEAEVVSQKELKTIKNKLQKTPSHLIITFNPSKSGVTLHVTVLRWYLLTEILQFS